MTSVPVTLSFYGASGTVTGSKYLLTVGERRILIDAGMFQGEKRWRDENWADFPVDPSTVTDLLLTHAHTDHVGYLPALVKKGFRGPVHATKGTIRLAEIVLRDGGKIQENQAKDHAEGGFSKHNPPLPLYTLEDVEQTLPLFREVGWDTDVDLGDGIVARWTRTAHILGSASIHVTAPGTDIVFSGDLGRHDHPILKPRAVPEPADHIVMECTYGDREHPEPDLPHTDFVDAINRTIDRGGQVVVPAFAIDRTETILKFLTDAYRAGRIPDVPVFVDGPMALAALDVYEDTSLDELADGITVADFKGMPRIRETRTGQESRRINEFRGPAVIISSSGMAEGGRVLHHLTRLLPDPRNTVVLTGYQAEGTRGRALEDGARTVKINGRHIKVKAEIVRDHEFSVHGDASDLIDWLRDLGREPECVHLVHGDPQVAPVFAKRIEDELGFTVVVARHGEVIRIDQAEPVTIEEGEEPLICGEPERPGE
ncbi:MBL fold metallo-hydrolase RNA specificity domain-containing protein [Aestuariimicrobium ganziense]|uniref:MBL fold metallo-hydrolase RNA specificity domain-containing protein n=1 Tax=Aestuariimicrobium ganziense TaxID=2773677 RepID=UPI001943C36F|nr:MBL fold metallo-hydrolase [Aestuariimicrobium ganziense]